MGSLYACTVLCVRLARLIFHDCYSDPLGWNNDVITEGDSPEPMHDILRDCSATPYLEEIEKAGQEDTVVVFDSLSPLLSHHPGSSVCRLLHGVGKVWLTILGISFPLVCVWV